MSRQLKTSQLPLTPSVPLPSHAPPAAGCPEGYVLSQNLTAVPLPPLRCLSCTEDLQCLECNGQLGCKSCAEGLYLKQVSGG